MIRVALAVLALGLSDQASAPGPAAPADACALPTGLRAALQQRFGSTRVLKASDLYEDERGLFNADRPGACPGFVTGRFFGAKERPATALALIGSESGQKIRLIVARPALATWTFFEVDELAAGATVALGTKSPGRYTDRASEKSLSSANEVVSLTAYGSWQRVYVWTGRNFEKVLTEN